MKGYMRRRGPSWELRAYLGRDPVSGRKRYASRGVRGSKRAAERVLRDMVAAAEAGVTHRAGATFGELCETWLTHASGHLAANTVTETRRILDRALLPRLGDVALAGLRPEHLDALYADLLRSGRRDGGAMSPATVQRIHGVVRRALTVGVRWGWLAANPAFIAMPPRSTRRPITPPAPTEVARLIDAADPDLGVFVLLAATTGARRGELCGLRWSEIDLTEQLVEITRAIIIVDGNCQDAPTKTRQTRRVALDPVTVDALRAQRRRSENRASLAARGLRSDGYVFSHDRAGGRPWRPDSTSRAFRQLCDEVGLDHVRLHDLRHFVATRLLASGVDVRTVSGRLGHSLASTTLNVYAAFVPDADRHAANVMGRLVTGAAAA
jgi:integrase